MEETHCLPLSGGVNPQIADIAKPEWHGDIKVHMLNPKYQTQDLSRICLFLAVHGPNVSLRHILLTWSWVLSLNQRLWNGARTSRHTTQLQYKLLTQRSQVWGLILYSVWTGILMSDRRSKLKWVWEVHEVDLQPADFQTTAGSRLWSGHRCHCWGCHTTAVCPWQDNEPPPASVEFASQVIVYT